MIFFKELLHRCINKYKQGDVEGIRKVFHAYGVSLALLEEEQTEKVKLLNHTLADYEEKMLLNKVFKKDISTTKELMILSKEIGCCFDTIGRALSKFSSEMQSTGYTDGDEYKFRRGQIADEVI